MFMYSGKPDGSFSIDVTTLTLKFLPKMLHMLFLKLTEKINTEEQHKLELEVRTIVLHVTDT